MLPIDQCHVDLWSASAEIKKSVDFLDLVLKTTGSFEHFEPDLLDASKKRCS